MIAKLLVVLVPVVLLGLTSCSPLVRPNGSGGPTELGKDVLLQQQLESYRNGVLAAYPDANLPPVEITKMVSPKQQNELIVDCMTEGGWDATLSSDDGVEFGAVAPAQEEALLVKLYECQSSYPIDSKWLDPLSRSELRRLYDYYVDELAPCVAERGIDVPVAPSFETFAESYKGNEQWHPYANVRNVPREDLDKLLSDCPQTPAEFIE